MKQETHHQKCLEQAFKISVLREWKLSERIRKNFHSLFFKENYNAKVFVFEPDDDNLSLLLRSKIKNKLKDFNIISLAISNEDKIESFLIDHISGATGSISSVKNVGQIRQELYLKKDIITLKLDNFYNIIEDISWIKIDTEGNEVNVIKGMIKILKLNKPNLIIECEDRNIYQIKELLKEINISSNVPGYSILSL